MSIGENEKRLLPDFDFDGNGQVVYIGDPRSPRPKKNGAIIPEGFDVVDGRLMKTPEQSSNEERKNQ